MDDMIDGFYCESELLKEVRARFDGSSDFFRPDDLDNFLNSVMNLISHFRNVTFKVQDDEVSGYWNVRSKGLPNLYQEHYALRFFSDCITDIGSQVYGVICVKHPNDQYADFYTKRIFEIIRREEISLLENIRLEEKRRAFRTIHDIKKLDDFLNNPYSIETKINAVEEFLGGLEQDQKAMKVLNDDQSKAKEILKKLEAELALQKNQELKNSISSEIRVSLIEEFGGQTSDGEEISTTAKLIILDQLGFFDLLMKIPEIGGSVNATAFYVARILDQKPTTIQSYLNKVIGGKGNDKSGSPYSSRKAVAEAKKVLGKYHIPYKENEED